MIIKAKEAQVGDKLVIDPTKALPGVNEQEPLVEEITGVGVNLCQNIVDIRTFSRAIFNIPLNEPIDVIRKERKK